MSKFGKPLGQYRVSQTNYWLTALYLAAVGAYGLWDQIQSGQFRLGFMLIVLIAWACAGFLLRLLQRNVQRVVVYEHGVQLVSRTGEQFVPWKQIDYVRCEANKRFIDLMVLKADGQHQRVRMRRTRQANEEQEIPWWSFETLFTQLSELSFEPRFAAARKQYQAGERLGFGPIALDKKGFYFKDASLAWDQVAALESNANQDFLAIMQQGKKHSWALLTLNELSNLDVFLALLAEFHGDLVEQKIDE
jgi:hypothetical protein